MQESVKLALVAENGMIGNRSDAYRGRSASIVGSRLGKRENRGRHLPAMLISMMIVIPMIVVLGFYAAAPARSAGPSPVDLGTAGNYVILAKSSITTTGTTHIWGDIGISPGAATDMTGFDLILDGSGTFSTSALVTGHVYASDYTVPTPSTLSTAVSDMETAYTNAALVAPDYTNQYAGDLTGQTLTAGCYVWSTGVLVSDGGSVTISGGASDVWIFQIAQTLNMGNGAAVTLSGGAQPSNIFWQVAGQVTLGTTAVMKGVILGQTAIVMNSGASLEGMALAQSAVTMIANNVYTPGTVIPEFSQVLIPLVGMMFVVAIVGKVRNQRKK